MIKQFADRRIKSRSGQLPISIISHLTANADPSQNQLEILCSQKKVGMQYFAKQTKCTYSAICQTAGNHTMSWDRKGEGWLCKS